MGRARDGDTALRCCVRAVGYTNNPVDVRGSSGGRYRHTPGGLIRVSMQKSFDVIAGVVYQGVSNKESDMSRTANEILTELYKVERMIASPESKGKRTALKAYHAKLGREYYKAIAA